MEVQLQTASVCSVYEKREGKKANFHTEFVIVRDLAFVSRWGGERGGKKKRPSACFIRVPGEQDYGAGMWCKAHSFWVGSHHCQQH